MNMNLTRTDRNEIRRRVQLINKYYQDMWQTYEAIMITKWKSYHRNIARERASQAMLDGLPQGLREKLDMDERWHGELVSLHDDIIPDSFRYFRQECDDRRAQYFRSYRWRLLGSIYDYLINTYGDAVPQKRLSRYIDFRALLKDTNKIFDYLNAWFRYFAKGRSIQDYTEHRNAILAQRDQVHYLRHAKGLVRRALRYNHFHLSSKRVLRFTKGSDEDGFDQDLKYLLGMPVINALIFWSSRYTDVHISPRDVLYQDSVYHPGDDDSIAIDPMAVDPNILKGVRLFKDRSFSMKFTDEKTSHQVYADLCREQYRILAPIYQDKIQHIPEDIDERIDTCKWEITHNYAFEGTSADQQASAEVKVFKRFRDTSIGFRKAIAEQRRKAGSTSQRLLPQTVHAYREYWKGVRRTLDHISDTTFSLRPRQDDKDIRHTIASLAPAVRDDNEAILYQDSGIDYTSAFVVKTLDDRLARLTKQNI